MNSESHVVATQEKELLSLREYITRLEDQRDELLMSNASLRRSNTRWMNVVGAASSDIIKFGLNPRQMKEAIAAYVKTLEGSASDG